jgi:hypothetical protein
VLLQQVGGPAHVSARQGDKMSWLKIAQNMAHPIFVKIIM